MPDASIGFIGGGRVARILLGGWRRAGVEVSQVLVCEPSDAAFAALEAAVPGVPIGRGDASAAGKHPVVFLAVHPPKLPEAADSIADQLNETAVVTSQLTPDEVVDLIPVKPLADFEPQLRSAYRSRLTALFDKIHP